MYDFSLIKFIFNVLKMLWYFIFCIEIFVDFIYNMKLKLYFWCYMKLIILINRMYRIF